MTISFLNGDGYIQCNVSEVEHGMIELNSSDLLQWHASRSRLVAFVTRELKVTGNDRGNQAVHVRLGTWARAHLRRVVALEFKRSPILQIGDAEVELSELMRWDGTRVYIDQEEMEIWARQSIGLRTGGKEYQHSRVRQRHRAELTALRNVRLQEMADALKRKSPPMKKPEIAEAIVESGEFGSMNPGTVARIIRVPIKMRRKKFASSPRP
jgi:hypothetical protein